MAQRHKHADLIHAWAEGAEIEAFNPDTGRWVALNAGARFYDALEYRIKPEKKPDVVCSARVGPGAFGIGITGGRANLSCTFSAETGELIKAEVIK